MSPRAPLLATLSAVALLTLAGCSTFSKPDGAVTGPFYAPANVRGVAVLPVEIRRVAILPVAADGPLITEESLITLDRTLATTFNRAGRAELSPVDRTTFARIAGGNRSLVSTSVLPNDFLNRIAKITGADAVLFVDVTAYAPFPPQVLGLRSRLVSVKTGEPLWNFDNVFTANDPTVVNAARRHILRAPVSTQAPADLSLTVLQNPERFADYASSATWATLPTR